ncbi:hypothetical protein [Streptomyces werraensis]|uniref:hypothetical protein n=1 Tax=Streptomyces werraensis TaxID=68284 RepID=UPI0033A5AC19
MSGVPLPEPPNADADNGPLKPAHEAAYYLGMAETFRILTRPGEPARPDVKELSTAVRAVTGGGTWYRRGDEAARRITASDQRIRNLPQDPDQLWALLATCSRPWTCTARLRNWTAATCAVTTSSAPRRRSAAPTRPVAGGPCA